MRVQHLARGDRGAVAVFVGLMGLLLTGMLAFAVDLGNAYSTQRRLSTAADGAALAAAQELAALGARCGTLVTGAERAASRAIADDYSSTRNAPGSALQAGATGYALSCPSGSDGGLVTVRNTQSVNYVFGNIFGIGSSTPTGEATAQYGSARTVTGLRPFAVCGKDPAVKALLLSGQPPNDGDALFAARPTVRINISKVGTGSSTDCGVAPGNWGVLDFDGGSNPTGEIREWTENGYREELDLVGGTFDGNPGIPSGGSLDTQMQSIVGDTITLPIFSSVTASGSNTRYLVSGFVSAQLCDWKFQNKQASPPDPTCDLTTPLLDLTTLLPVTDYLELRFRQSFTVGEFTNCGLSCPVTGVKTVRLVPTP